MPFSISNPPKQIQKLPKGAQRIWIAAFNASFKDGNDATASKIAWAAVKRSYRKVGDKWVRKMPAEVAAGEAPPVETPTDERLLISDNSSWEDIESAVSRALHDRFGFEVWRRATFADHVVYEKGTKLFKVGWATNDEGEVEII